MKNKITNEAKRVIGNGAFCDCGEQLSLSAKADYHQTHLKTKGMILASYSVWCDCEEYYVHLFPNPNDDKVHVAIVAIHPTGPGTLVSVVPIPVSKDVSIALNIEVNCQIKKIPTPIARAKPMIMVNLNA